MNSIIKKSAYFISRYIDEDYYICFFENIKDLFSIDEWEFKTMQFRRLLFCLSFIGIPLSMFLLIFVNVILGLAILLISIICDINSDIEAEEFGNYLWSSGISDMNKYIKQKRKK